MIENHLKADVIRHVEATCYELAEDYSAKYNTPQEAANVMANWQIAKCATSGFVTSLGGLITLPVAIPANIASVLYVQLRMIAAIAILAGYDPHDDRVQTFTYMCLVGMSLSEFVSKSAVQIANKIGIRLVKKVPYEVIKKINKKVSFRLITKFGEKGIINLSKLVPVLGGVVGGTFDLLSTKTISDNAIRMFFKEKPFEDLEKVIVSDVEE